MQLRHRETVIVRASYLEYHETVARVTPSDDFAVGWVFQHSITQVQVNMRS